MATTAAVETAATTAAAVETAATTAAAVETAATTAAAVIASAASESASNGIPVITAAIRHRTSNITRASVPITRPAIVSAAIAIDSAVTVAITTPVPGAGSNKQAAGEPRRAIVAIRSASIRIVAVVAIGADRSGIAVAAINRAADPDTNRHLRMGISRGGHQQDTEQCEIA
jgi:hypothetical protein